MGFSTRPRGAGEGLERDAPETSSIQERQSRRLPDRTIALPLPDSLNHENRGDLVTGPLI
jgi:hypothetical protein